MSPNYLVQTPDGTLWSYWNKDVLFILLTQNKGEQVRIYEKQRHDFTDKYVETTEADLRKRGAA